MSFDKLLHFLVGYCLAATLSISPIGAIIVVVLVGAAKEGYDFISNKYFGIPHELSFLDFLATVVGGLAGLGIPCLANYFFTQFPILLGL